jgi:hypothetical protein
VRDVTNPKQPWDQEQRHNNSNGPKEQVKHKCSPPAAFVHGVSMRDSDFS